MDKVTLPTPLGQQESPEGEEVKKEGSALRAGAARQDDPETILRDAITGWVAAARAERRKIRLGIALAPDVNRNRARTYMRTARSLKIEEQTGVSVCVCCYKPFSVHRLSHQEEMALEAKMFKSSQTKIQGAASDLDKVESYARARGSK